MKDAGHAGTDQAGGQTRHWLVNSATITDYAGTGPASGDASTATTFYHSTVQSFPIPSQLCHHSEFQPQATFTPPDGLTALGVPLACMNFPGYVQTSNLGRFFAVRLLQHAQCILYLMTVSCRRITSPSRLEQPLFRSLRPRRSSLQLSLYPPPNHTPSLASSMTVAAHPSQSSSGATSSRAARCLTVPFSRCAMMIISGLSHNMCHVL
jgi:hypothetical protein